MISHLQLSYGVATQAMQNERVSGDQWFVKKFSDAILVAVIDGLGHGKKAADSAKKIIEVLNTSQEEDTLFDIINRCHESLQGSRGAVLMLAKIQKNYEVTWMNVGNILGLHWIKKTQKKDVLLPQGGVVGFRLPLLRSESFIAHPGDMLIIATDGLKNHFIQDDFHHTSPQKVADEFFKKYRKLEDDALIFVLSWEGSDDEF